MTADQLLQQLGLSMNLPRLALDANGCARVLVDGRTAVNFELDAANGCLQLYSTLAPLPAQDREAVFLAMLEGNLFGAQTLGATLAVDSVYGEIVLCRCVPLEGADASGFALVFEGFVAAAEEWTRKLQGAIAPTQASAAPTAAAMEPRVQAHFLRV